MTVGEYQYACAKFLDPVYRKVIEATAKNARAAARNDFFLRESRLELRRLMAAGATDDVAARAAAEATTRATMKNLDALHALDSGLGGDPGAMSGMGNASINPRSACKDRSAPRNSTPT